MTSSLAQCPIHGQLVIQEDGVLAGKCWGCVNEAARGKQWLRDHRGEQRFGVKYEDAR